MKEYAKDFIPGYMGVKEYQRSGSLGWAFVVEGLSIAPTIALGLGIGYSSNSLIGGAIGLIIYPVCRHVSRDF